MEIGEGLSFPPETFLFDFTLWSFYTVLNVLGSRSRFAHGMSIIGTVEMRRTHRMEGGLCTSPQTLRLSANFLNLPVLSSLPQNVTQGGMIQVKNVIRGSVSVKSSATDHSEPASARLHQAR